MHINRQDGQQYASHNTVYCWLATEALQSKISKCNGQWGN